MQSVMLDGSMGIRQGIKAFNPNALLGMCFFHMMAAVKEHENLLPREKLDISTAVRDIAILATFDPSRFNKASTATLNEWRRRVWTVWTDYYEATWLQQLNGWNVGFLGLGAPRTNNALESSWRLLHAFTKGTISPATGLDVLFKNVIPHHVRNKSQMLTVADELSVEDRSEALQLSTSDRMFQKTALGELWYFCKRRVCKQRLVITRDDIDRYEALHTGDKVWSFADVAFLASVRKFNTTSCSCVDALQYKSCKHMLAARVREGLVHVSLPISPQMGGRPGKHLPAKSRPKIRESADDFCAICQRHCTNSKNLASHVQGTQHKKIALALTPTLRANAHTTIDLLKFSQVHSNDLREEDTVLFSSNLRCNEIEQCQVRKVEDKGAIVLLTYYGKKNCCHI